MYAGISGRGMVVSGGFYGDGTSGEDGGESAGYSGGGTPIYNGNGITSLPNTQ